MSVSTVLRVSDVAIESLQALLDRFHLILEVQASGEDIEEAAVCYLQILLADCIDSIGSERLMQDMDTWGYSFRLGTTRRWFDNDAEDAHAWLLRHALLDERGRLSFRLRSSV